MTEQPSNRRRDTARRYYEQNKQTGLNRSRKWKERKRSDPSYRAEEARKAREYRRNNPDKMSALWSRRSRSAKRRRYWIGKYKVAKGCEMCGYNSHPVALQFDHIDPSLKQFDISRVSRKSISDVVSEIRKCRVLCANCHSIHTYNQNKNTEGP